MRAFVICLCLAAGQADADCIDFGNTGLVVTVDSDFRFKRESGWDVLILESNGRESGTIALRPIDAFGIVGGEVLRNGFSIRFQTKAEKIDAHGDRTAILRGQLMSRLPVPLTFEVSCLTQGKDPDAEWCKPLIEKMRMKADGCATGDE